MLAKATRGSAGSEEPGGATTSSHKTFDLGALKPGKTVEAIWKLSAVKAGRYTLLYGVEAGLSGEAKAKTASGVSPGGSFVVQIDQQPPKRKSPTPARSSKSASRSRAAK